MLGPMGLTSFSHSLALFYSLVPGVLFAGSIYFIERRGKREGIPPHRQVDISSVLNSIPEAALIVDREDHVIDANAIASQILGMSREELLRASSRQLGQAIADVSYNGHKTRAIVARALRGE